MLTKEIADEIVAKTMSQLNHNINIMDQTGLILSSGDQQRVHTYHEAALEVVRTGKPIVIHDRDVSDWQGVKEGVNLPIHFQQKIVGVIGISGAPKTIRDIASLVVSMTELMIQQIIVMKEVDWKYRMREFLLDEMLHRSPNIERITQKLLLLDYELEFPCHVIIFKVKNTSVIDIHNIYQRIGERIDERKTIYGFVDTETLVFIVSDSQKSNLVSIMKHLDEVLTLYFSSVKGATGYEVQSINDIHEGYSEITAAIQYSNKRISTVKDSEVAVLLNEIDIKKKVKVKKRIQLDLSEELKETLHVFLQQDLNVKQAAEALYIHRNTLLYRLNKIEQITGYNPRSFYDATTLYVSELL
ncbi:Carbohydrate diacid regulator [Bacillus sp. THAF10]|uniref:CdaR family transcriptional regulator n=1 Tax=Bacillus sp. THAF10 TaxID=2587848 RepID=UPI0012682186|nr:sugar diacid recognition domain-containing protein [Bacillus sp. THAF10]QFT90799.1 Carbohydrate diacid regulator [Bacillus sp. THAF10]